MFAVLAKVIARSVWIRFAVGLILVAWAVMVSNGLWLFVDRPISSPNFLLVILLSAWLLGFRAGIVTSVASGLAMKYFFVAPYHEFIGDRQVMVRIAVFTIEGIILSWLIHRLRIVNERMRQSREQLRALTERQRTVREDEQKRIAREIHDELGQVLTGVKMDIHFLNRRIETPETDLTTKELSHGLDELATVIDGAISSVRRISSELRPSILDDFGLVAALSWQAGEFERMTKIPCFFRSDADSVDLGAESNTAVFRIFQETLTNIARHAGADKVHVRLQRNNGHLLMTVRDDGSGIDPGIVKEKRSLGILGMQERARLISAELKIAKAADGGGTTVSLRVPMPSVPLPSLN